LFAGSGSGAGAGAGADRLLQLLLIAMSATIMVVAYRSLMHFARTTCCSSRRQRINFGAQLMIWRLRHDPATVGVLAEERDLHHLSGDGGGQSASVGMDIPSTAYRPTAFQVWFARKGEVARKEKAKVPSSSYSNCDGDGGDGGGDGGDGGDGKDGKDGKDGCDDSGSGGIPDLLDWERQVLDLGTRCSRVAFQLTLFAHQVLNSAVSTPTPCALAHVLACVLA
jgi:hypothetical protein